MLVSMDDPRVLDWVNNAADDRRNAGSFVANFAKACLHADHENYRLIRPALVILIRKYPEYSDPKWKIDG